MLTEPFKIKVVEPIRRIARDERLKIIREAGPAACTATSPTPGAGTYRLESVVRDIFGFKHMIPTHQGRVAEHLLFSSVVRRGRSCPTTSTSTPRVPISSIIEHVVGRGARLRHPRGL